MKKKIKIIICLLLITIITGCKNDLKEINTLKDLNNKNIGIITGSEYDSISKEKLDNPNLFYYNSYSDQIAALKSGKLDAFLTDEPLAKEIIKNNDGLKILDEKLTEDSYAFAINPQSKDLQKKVNSVLSEMKEKGKLAELEDKWMGNNEEKKELENYTYNSTNGTLKFGVVSGSAPFVYVKNNKIVGYDVDVARYIAYKLKYKLEVVEMQYDGIIPAVVSGKVDMAGCSIIVTEERKKSVLFSDPDYTGGIVIVTRKIG